jgi:hypothetical protein
MFNRNLTTSLIVAATSIIVTSQVYAVPTQMVHIDTPLCDTLFIPDSVHELGDVGVFPANEALFATDLGPIPISACPNSDDPTVLNAFVDIRNLSGIAWEEVWYVADAETTLSNYDGEANEFGFPPLQEAFRIDNDVSDPGGVNHALIFESMTPDGIWEINETWQFIIQDYTNLSGLSAADINSIGVGDNSPNVGIKDSSGSIIAVTQVPEPASLTMLGIGAVAAGIRRR